MKTTLLFALLTYSTFTFSQANYSTSCVIRDGDAIGIVQNHGTGFSISGPVSFCFFNSSGFQTTTRTRHTNEYISHKSTEEVEDVSASATAKSCRFDISQAIEEPQPSCTKKVIRYTTNCKIEDGKAIGIVESFRDSFWIRGYVQYYLYDCDGDLIDVEKDRTTDLILSNDIEEINLFGSINDDACSCRFVIENAVEE
ncbi:hypothetical protein N9R81_04080 [Flavobacteriales bacterium]|nr:hypothetical protein [Flavobacteriales bacterium]